MNWDLRKYKNSVSIHKFYGDERDEQYPHFTTFGDWKKAGEPSPAYIWDDVVGWWKVSEG